MNPIVIIPARIAASRLPRKPLADIGGMPMIVHVLARAQEADIGRVVVATDTVEIADAVRQGGGLAILTRPGHPSGSDRIWEALTVLDPDDRYDVVVNLQGDLPTVDPATVRATLEPLVGSDVQIGTAVAAIVREDERIASQVVKMVGTPVAPRRQRALYFTRATAPWGEGPLWHHIGLYAWRRTALARFVSLPPSALELREKLEQLRALEAGMRIDAMEVDAVPLGVDTPDDLARARAILAGGKMGCPHSPPGDTQR